MLCSPVQEKSLDSIANDVDGQLLGRGMQLFAEVARRASASFFAVGQDNDEARLVAVVKHLGRLLARPIPAACGPPASKRIHYAHDGVGRVRRWLQIEADVALLVRAPGHK